MFLTFSAIQLKLAPSHVIRVMTRRIHQPVLNGNKEYLKVRTDSERSGMVT